MTFVLELLVSLLIVGGGARAGKRPPGTPDERVQSLVFPGLRPPYDAAFPGGSLRHTASASW